VTKVKDADPRSQVRVYVESLKDTLFAAGINWDIYSVYKRDDNRVAHHDVLLRYGRFFAFSLHARFVASIIAIYRALERNASTINLYILLDAIRAAHMISEQDLQPFRQQLSSFEAVWHRVAIIRSSVFAHENRDQDSDYYFQRANLSPEQISGLINDTQSLLSSLTVALYKNPITFEHPIADELVQLLTDLRHLRKSS
jgi:hypothetical protein